MYSSYPGLILGFHGCDETVGRAIVAGEQVLKPSENEYDWLGHGFYFWEFNRARAQSFAQERSERALGLSSIKKPFVIGAVIDLGYCLNLLDERGIRVLGETYKVLELVSRFAGPELPENAPAKEPLRRNLDCAVIELGHSIAKQDGERELDSVRGAFIEGEPVYPGAGVRCKNHIQICVRNPNCIKGFFLPREIDKHYPRPHDA